MSNGHALCLNKRQETILAEREIMLRPLDGVVNLLSFITGYPTA
jgi:hypothetical protein